VWVLVLGFFMLLLAVSFGFCLVLDSIDRLGGLRGKVGSACEEFEYSEGVYCVNDTYLIVPSVNSHLLLGEIQHICDWVESNNLKLSVSKSTETIFTSPHFKETKLPLPPPTPTITGLNRLTVLGVVVSYTFKFTEHV